MRQKNGRQLTAKLFKLGAVILICLRAVNYAVGNRGYTGSNVCMRVNNDVIRTCKEKIRGIITLNILAFLRRN